MATHSLLLLTLSLLITACGAPVQAQAVARATLVTSGDTNPQALEAAEQGAIGKPTIVFFHAQWCKVCREAAPTMDELEQEYNSRVAVVRMDIDEPAARSAVAHYRVSATPTFVLLSADGNMLALVPGWPGRETMEMMIEQMLAAQP